MKMSKNAIVLLSIGGVTLIAAGVLAFLVFGAMGARTAAREDLESVRSSVSRLNQSKVKPWVETLKLVEANTALVDGWQRSSYDRAGEGDVTLDDTMSGAAFKQQLQTDMAALQQAKSKSGAAVVPTTFSQTFLQYIDGASIPAAEELAQLQRHWFDIRLMAELLASNGVAEVVKIEPITKATAKAAAPVDQATQRRQDKAKKKKQKAGKEEPEASGPVQIAETYQLEFRTRPSGAVNVLNAFTAAKRFMTVKNFGFFRENDMIGKAIGDKNQKTAAEVKPKGRARRLLKQKESEVKEEAVDKKKEDVSDPDKEAPLKMSMTVEINDFGTAALKAAETATEATGAAEPAEETEVAE